LPARVVSRGAGLLQLPDLTRQIHLPGEHPPETAIESIDAALSMPKWLDYQLDAGYHLQKKENDR
jgi:hypothetical protein